MVIIRVKFLDKIFLIVFLKKSLHSRVLRKYFLRKNSEKRCLKITRIINMCYLTSDLIRRTLNVLLYFFDSVVKRGFQSPL